MRYYSKLEKKFDAGDIIFSENSDCDGMYIIDTGHVRIFKTVGEGKECKEVELCTLGPKAMFGEMAMIDQSKRSASVQALEKTKCTVITKKIFEDQLNRIPYWMVNMIKILVSRLRETNNKLRGIIEEYTTAPDDNGGIFTLNDSSRIEENDTQKKEAKEAKPETEEKKIMDDLFDTKKS